MGALDYIADTLGKPRRALFGLLAGRPEELLNLLPFSDTLGMTDPGRQTRGADLMGGNPWAGAAMDVVGDPLNWLAGLAAVKGIGKAASLLRGGAEASPLAGSLAEAQALLRGTAAERQASTALADSAAAMNRSVPATVDPAAYLANWRAMHAPGGLTPPAEALTSAGKTASSMGFGRGGRIATAEDMLAELTGGGAGRPIPDGGELLNQMLGNLFGGLRRGGSSYL